MKLAPDDPRPYFLLGAAYEEAGQESKAEQVFQEAQQFRRYLGEAWTNLGAIAFRRGDLSKATWYLSRAVTRSPMRPKAHFNYALLLSAKRERDRALDELKVASELDPEDSEIHYLAGVILLRQGRFNDAKAKFEEALRRRPDHPDAKHNLALLLESREALRRRALGLGRAVASRSSTGTSRMCAWTIAVVAGAVAPTRTLAPCLGPSLPAPAVTYRRRPQSAAQDERSGRLPARSPPASPTACAPPSLRS